VGRSVRISCSLSAAVEVARPASTPGLRRGRVPASAGRRGSGAPTSLRHRPRRCGLFYLTRQ
jgi:hypothetical protein